MMRSRAVAWLGMASRRDSASEVAVWDDLVFAPAVPVFSSGFRHAVDRLHQHAAQAVAAFKVGVDDFEAHFVESSAAQKHLRADMTHAGRDVDIGFRSDAQVVFLRAHTAAQTEFADLQAGLAPRTAA